MGFFSLSLAGLIRTFHFKKSLVVFFVMLKELKKTMTLLKSTSQILSLQGKGEKKGNAHEGKSQFLKLFESNTTLERENEQE